MNKTERGNENVYDDLKLNIILDFSNIYFFSFSMAGFAHPALAFKSKKQMLLWASAPKGSVLDLGPPGP